MDVMHDHSRAFASRRQETTTWRDVDGIADLRRFASEMASACARIQIDSGGELENSRWMGCELRASRLAARDLAEFAAAVRRRLMMLAGLNRSQKEL